MSRIDEQATDLLASRRMRLLVEQVDVVLVPSLTHEDAVYPVVVTGPGEAWCGCEAGRFGNPCSHAEAARRLLKG